MELSVTLEKLHAADEFRAATLLDIIRAHVRTESLRRQ